MYVAITVNGSEISLESKMSFDNYNLYYNYYSLRISDISTTFGTFNLEGFYDDFGLSNDFNGINTFSGNLFGSRLLFNNNLKNLYYQIGIGNDNFKNMKENIFYEFALAYLIPIDDKNSIVLNAKLNRSRFQMNPLSSYLGVSNQTININTQFKLSKVFIEATSLTSYLNEIDVENDLLMNKGLITKVPNNKLTYFYIYAYTPLYNDINAGLVFSASNSEVNNYQPTYLTSAENFTLIFHILLLLIARLFLCS